MYSGSSRLKFKGWRKWRKSLSFLSPKTVKSEHIWDRGMTFSLSDCTASDYNPPVLKLWLRGWHTHFKEWFTHFVARSYFIDSLRDILPPTMSHSLVSQVAMHLFPLRLLCLQSCCGCSSLLLACHSPWHSSVALTFILFLYFYAINFVFQLLNEKLWMTWWYRNSDSNQTWKLLYFIAPPFAFKEQKLIKISSSVRWPFNFYTDIHVSGK